MEAQKLLNRGMYRNGLALEIETMGQVAVSIANRWFLGWPDRVTVLLANQAYLPALENQMNREKDLWAEHPELSHLTRSEMMAEFEIPEAPPSIPVSEAS